MPALQTWPSYRRSCLELPFIVSLRRSLVSDCGESSPIAKPPRNHLKFLSSEGDSLPPGKERACDQATPSRCIRRVLFPAHHRHGTSQSDGELPWNGIRVRPRPEVRLD